MCKHIVYATIVNFQMNIVHRRKIKNRKYIYIYNPHLIVSYNSLLVNLFRAQTWLFVRWWSYMLSVMKFVFSSFIDFFQDVSKKFTNKIPWKFLASKKQNSSSIFTHGSVFYISNNSKKISTIFYFVFDNSSKQINFPLILIS